MTKLLLVEDEHDLRELICDLLEMEDFVVTAVQDGQEAKELIETNGNFDIILSDIQLPRMTGIQLLKWLRESNNTPFVLMSGFSNALETQTAHELGADDFVAKPFKSKELLEALRQCLDDDKKSAEEKANIEHRFCKVKIEDFVSKERMKFNVYLKLSEHKFVKLAHEGDNIDQERVKDYENKGVSHLYIKKEDFQKLVDFNLKTMVSSSIVNEEEKVKIINATSDVILEKVFVDGIDEESFENAKHLAESGVKCLADHKVALKLLNSLNEHSEFLYAHSLGVAMYSIMIAREIGYADPKALFHIFLGGLFHDIGKKDIPKELIAKKESLLNEHEINDLKEHINRGEELIREVPAVNEDVISIIMEHHERNDGSGYPLGIGRNEISPYAQIVIVANQFAKYGIAGPHCMNLSAFEVVAKLKSEKEGLYSSDVMDALVKIVQCFDENAA